MHRRRVPSKVYLVSTSLCIHRSRWLIRVGLARLMLRCEDYRLGLVGGASTGALARRSASLIIGSACARLAPGGNFYGARTSGRGP